MRRMLVVTLAAAFTLGCGSDDTPPEPDPVAETPTPAPAPAPKPAPAPAPAPAPEQPARASLGPRIGLEIKLPAEGKLEDLVREIGKVAEQRIFVENRVKSKVVQTNDLEGLPWREGLEHIAQRARCKIEIRQSGIIMLTPRR